MARPGCLGGGESIVVGKALIAADQQVPGDEGREAARLDAERRQCAAGHADRRAGEEARAPPDAPHQQRSRDRRDGRAQHHRRHGQRRPPLVGCEHGADDAGQRHRKHDRREHQRLAGCQDDDVAACADHAERHA
jgi:hypothetical protein